MFYLLIKRHLHYHVVWEGFKKNLEKNTLSSKNKLQHIYLLDITGTSKGTGLFR